MAHPDDLTGLDAERPLRLPRPRWGLRTLGWLGLAFVCLVTSNVLFASGVGSWALLPLAGTVIGFGGAGYCSLRGLLSASWLGR